MLRRFKIKLFSEENKEKYPVLVPRHSQLRCVKVLTEEIGAGIFVIYDCPDLITEDFTDEFIIPLPGERTPNADYIDIIDAVFSDTDDKGNETQSVLLIPIYRMRSGAMVGGIDEENRLKVTDSTEMPDISPVKSTRKTRGKSLEVKGHKNKLKKV